MPVGPFATNCVIVEDELTRDALVIDPGSEADRILGRAERLGVRPVRIVLTHGHLDHCMEAAALARRLGIEVSLHDGDLLMYRNLAEQVRFLMGPSAMDLLGPDPVVETAAMREGDRFCLGSTGLTVVHLPGHSPGSVGLLSEGLPGTLICGDTVFRDGVGRTDLWGGDFATLERSIRERILSLPDETRLVPGHGGETTVGREKRYFRS
jgi:glyoxylase-like metal-dependent hydrolase (beta-lactamase superfamily II)